MKLSDITAFFFLRSSLAELDESIKDAREAMKMAFAEPIFTLDERWQLFLDYSHLLEDESYGDGEIDVLKPGSSLYDEFYVERYQRREYKDMDEQIQDTIHNPWSDEVKEDAEIFKANYDAWREAVLSKGYAAFTYDW